MDGLEVVGLSARVVSTAAISTFFGGSIYINVVETPARVALANGEAIVAHFQATFPRAMGWQKKLAAISFLGGAVGCYLDTDPCRWLCLAAEGCILAGIFLQTKFFIMPVNFQLMGPDLYNGSEAPRKKGSAWAVDMVNKWDRVHAVRTVASGAAMILWGTYWANKIYKFI